MFDYLEARRNTIRRRRVRRFQVTVFALFMVVLVGLFLVFIRTPLFEIRTVNVDGNKLVSASDIETEVLNILNDRSIIENIVFEDNNTLFAMLQKNSITEDIQLSHPTIKYAKISVDLFKNTVNVLVQERDQYGVWCSIDTEDTKHCWWFDSDGVLFMEGPALQGGLIRKVMDYSRLSLKQGDRALSEQHADVLRSIFVFLEASGLKIKTLGLYERENAEIQTEDDNYPMIYFSLRHDPAFALVGLKKIHDRLDTLKYVDLRVKNRVYYK